MANIKGFITNLGKYNEGELIGEWIDFPISEEELEEVKARIGINAEYEEFFFTDWEGPDFGEYPSIDRINEFAEAVNDRGLDDDVVAAIVDNFADIDDAIDCVINESFTVYPECYSDQDLGYYVVDELYGGPESLDKDTLEMYFDYDGYGRDIRLNGSFTDYEGGMIEFY